MKRKGKSRVLINIIAILGGFIVLSLGGGLIFTAGERSEAKNLPIAAVNFSSLKDGTYSGEYEGGRYKWRATKAQVTVYQGRVTDIKALGDKRAGCNENPKITDELYDRVIDAQSLQVDTVSGATLTSKAYLKSVENALAKAQKR